jgi:Protein of unknown function (DUF1266)
MKYTILVLVGLAILAFVLPLVIKRLMGAKNDSSNPGQNTSNQHRQLAVEAVSLTEAQKSSLAYGAILSNHRGEDILGFQRIDSLKEHFEGLSQQWGIASPDGAKQTLESLLALRKSSELDQTLAANDDKVQEIKGQIRSELKLTAATIEQTKSTYAWDTCRAASLAKWCYWCGYLTSDEALTYVARAAKIARERGSNWTDYTVSFLLGRTIQGFDINDVIVGASQLHSGKGPLLVKVKDIDVYSRVPFKG